MAKIRNDSQDNRFPYWWRRSQHRGYVYERTYRGTTIVQGWPKPKGPARTPAEAEAENLFKKLSYAQLHANEVDRVAAEAIAKGSQYTWRDVLGRAMVGRLIQWEFTTKDLADLMDIQTLLNQISDQQGAMLFRTADLWVVVLNPDNHPVMLWNDDDQAPEWGDFPPLGDTGVTPGTYTLATLTVGADGRLSAASSGSVSVPTAANPTATASDVAVNGSASTFMRSDAAPAIQKASTTAFGLMKFDGTTLTETGGVGSVATSVGAAYGFSPGWRSQRWYNSGFVGTPTVFTLSANTLYASPVFIPANYTIDAISIFLTGAVALSTCTVGVYANANGIPGALLFQQQFTTSGTVGIRQATGLAQPLAAGWYWLAINASHAIATRAGGITQAIINIFGLPNALTPNQAMSGLSVASTYVAGALANPFPTPNDYTGSMPHVYLAI